MAAHIIDGRSQAADLIDALSDEIRVLKQDRNIIPGLAVLRIGDNPASIIYVRNKQKACQKIGIEFWEYPLPASTSLKEIETVITQLNQDPKVHGILLQLPLPAPLDPYFLLQCIDPRKDVDGLHDLNIGRLWSGRPHFVPCTPLGCMKLLQKICDLKGKHAVVLGRSQIVGRPLSHLLNMAHCTVTLAHSYTPDVQKLTCQADVVVAAMGKPQVVKKDWIKPGAIVVDVGISRFCDDTGKVHLLGDVDFMAVKEVASAITPVPGGVGPMTIACLLENVVKAAILFY